MRRYKRKNVASNRFYAMYIHERENWTDFKWDAYKLMAILENVTRKQGLLYGRLASLGFDSKLKAMAENLTYDVVCSSEIEGIRLNVDEVRSSIARKLGIENVRQTAPSHYVVGIQDASIQEQAYADYLELLKSLNVSTTRSISATDFPEYYGGCYVNDEGKLVVLVKEGESEPIRQLSQATRSSSMIYETSQYSFNELQQVVEEIRQKALAGNEFLFKNVSLYGISEKDNIVEVGLLYNTPSVVQEFKNKISDSPKIKFINSGKLVLNSGIDCANEIKTHRNGLVHNASVGYRAKDKNGNIGIVTAGHFIKINETFNNANDVAIGKCLYSKEENYIDAAFCSITSKDYAPTNRILYMPNIDKDRMYLLRIILTSVCLVWTCFIHGTDKSRTLSVEKDSILKTNTYLKDSIKISAVVSKEDAQYVIVRIENHGKKFIRIGRIYGLQTFIDNKWTYLIKAKKEYLSIPPNDVITIMYNLCVERIRNKSIGYTYSVNRKNRIKLDVYDNKKIIGKISCEFIVPVNMVWNNKDGLILIQYD